MTIVVNFFAGSGCGKTSISWDVSAELKWIGGINVEYVAEYVKHQLFEERSAIFKDQDYIFGKQKYSIKRIVDCGKLDVIITDSPILLSAFYNNPIDKDFNKNILNKFNQFNNMNYFLERVKSFNPIGRFQTAEQAKLDDIYLKELLDKFGVSYQIIKGEKASVEIIANQIKSIILAEKQAEAWHIK